MVLLAWNGWGQGVVTYTSGTGTFTVPCGVSSITVQVWGAGGGGARGSRSNPNDFGGGGGGGGGYTVAVFTVTPNQTFSYAVGLGGNGQTGNNAATAAQDGSNSTFGTLTAEGGKKGIAAGASNGTGGAGGGATGGTPSSGSNGGDGQTNVGGGNGGNNGTGTNGTSINAVVGAVVNASGFGGGGAGGYGNNGDGGNGGNGQIVVSWTTVSAGPSALLDPCVTTDTLSAGAVPSGYTGTWSVSPTGPTFSNSNDPNAIISNLALNQTYTFRWTISAGSTSCSVPSYSETFVTTRGVDAFAGYDQSLCNSSYTLDADPVPTNYTGTWSCVSGACGSISISNVNDPNATVTGLTSGNTVTLQWTVSGACSNSDQVVLRYPLICNDDPCGAVSIPLNESCVPQTFNSAITTSATATSYPPPPGCGNFGAFTTDRRDVWYVVGPVGTDGIVNINLNGASGDYANAAIYSGSSCSDLSLESCHQNLSSGGTLNIQQAGLTPGEYVYIRVWDYYNYAPLDLTICAFGNTSDSQIIPGNNSTCGATFYDLGGSTGTYTNNTLTTYTICPSTPGEFISVNFTLLDFYTSADHIIVLNGSQGTAPIIADLSGSGAVNYTIQSTAADGCLTFIFQSNGSGIDNGWAANVSCVTTPSSSNHMTGTCTEANCLGGCLRTLCGIPATVGFQGAGFGVQELNESNNSCWTAPERCSNWFYINPETAGDLSMNMYVNNGQDQDFLLWEAYGNELQCPAETGNDPLLCNFAGATSQGTGFNDALTGTNPAYEPSLQITQADIDANLYYILLVQTYSNGNSCPNPDVQITFGGSASLGCTAPIPLNSNIVMFNGVNEEERNLLYWESETDERVSYYTLERSNDGEAWSLVGSVYSSNATEGNFYRMYDEQPYSPFTYYRLNQVDMDGESQYTEIISISRGALDNNWVSNLFPNPTADVFSFQYQGFNFEEAVNVSILNSMGQVITQEEHNVKNKTGITVNTSELAVGTYMVLITQGDQKEIKKLSIVR
jgi:hypothetical protein